jgi:TetR/AcrR family acrAB operon transcriptional repressor
MVRKTKGEAQATYDALLDAAEKEFSAKGVTRTTLNDVACAAGVTRGAIYWHFKDKGALFQAMCDRVFLPMQALLHEVSAAPSVNPIASLRQLMLHMLMQVANDARQRTVFDIMFHRCEKNDEMTFLVHEREKRGECLARLELLLREAVTQKILPEATDTAVAVQALNAYLIGLIYEWLVDPAAYDLGRHAEAMIDIFLAGLLARPPLKAPADNR